MTQGYKIFPRSKAFLDNWDRTFRKKKDKATFENCIFIDRQTIDEAMASLFGKPIKEGILKEITE